jgi:glycerate 2-kinase
MDAKIIAKQIFLAGVESVLPDKIIRRQVFIRESTLFVFSLHFSLENTNRIFVIGAGKASALMAKEIENVLGDRITEGHVVVKYGHACKLQRIDITEAGHPIPDSNGYLATQKILEIVKQAGEKDLVICLLSGGGSALLVDFPEGGTINDIIATNDLLLKSGAGIKEINTVRKHLSKVKGGQLTKAAYPATLVSLILSDVIGDPLDVIASGPTVPDPTTFTDSVKILEKFDLISRIPLPLINCLRNGVEGIYPETPKPGDPVFDYTQNIILGSNKIALQGCFKKAIALGAHPLIITSELEGEAIKIGEQLVERAKQIQKDDTFKKPCCLLFGGEPTVKVNGPGTGGRNQHLALAAAILLANLKGVTLLSAGTDGTDGPTPVAGAVVDTTTVKQALASGINAEKHLNNFDSFHFFETTGGHVITGPTMTNVMDLVIMVIE